jgi:formylmethanofuran dehydrogenase subunit C
MSPDTWPPRLHSAGRHAALVVGTSKRALTVGDLFVVSGKPGDTVKIEGGSSRLDFVGAELDKER